MYGIYSREISRFIIMTVNFNYLGYVGYDIFDYVLCCRPPLLRRKFGASQVLYNYTNIIAEVIQPHSNDIAVHVVSIYVGYEGVQRCKQRWQVALPVLVYHIHYMRMLCVSIMCSNVVYGIPLTHSTIRR